MKYEEALDRINEFETEENIEVFNSEYGNLWPLFRMFIVFKIRSTDVPLVPKSNLYRKLGEIKRALTTFRNYAFSKKNKLDKYSGIEELWYSLSRYREENNRSHNKYLDPYIKYLAKDNSLVVENNPDKPALFSFDDIGHDKSIVNLHSFRINFDLKYAFFGDNFKLKKIDKKYKFSQLAESFPVVSAYDFFMLYCRYVEDYKLFLSLFENFSGLKKIILSSFYDYRNLALVAAANESGIETVDAQHGVQSDVHIAYSNWKYRNDYKMLPTSFFVFTDKEKILLEKTFPKANVNVVGNLIHKDWAERNNKSEEHKTVVLFTLQSIVLPSNHFVYEFFKYINTNFKNLSIVLRLHPRHKYVKKGYQENMKLNGINYTWDDSQDVFDVLNRTCFHMTLSSTVVEDSLLMNLPSFVLDQRGKINYQTHIDNTNLVFHVKNVDKMTKIFENKIS